MIKNESIILDFSVKMGCGLQTMTGIVRFKHFSSQKTDRTLYIIIKIKEGTIVNRVWLSLIEGSNQGNQKRKVVAYSLRIY